MIRRKVILSVSTDEAARGRTDVHITAFKELGDFIAEHVVARRSTPRDDLIGALAESEVDGDRLSEREVVLTTATFVMAGAESLSSFMSLFALNLCDHPQERAELLGNPGLMAPAIEESLRFNTSAQRFKRVLTHDTKLHGQLISVPAPIFVSALIWLGSSLGLPCVNSSIPFRTLNVRKKLTPFTLIMAVGRCPSRLRKRAANFCRQIICAPAAPGSNRILRIDRRANFARQLRLASESDA